MENTLKEYVENNVKTNKDSHYYDENFCWACQSYYGSKGEFSEADIEYMRLNGISPRDIDCKEEFKCEICGKFIAEDEGITLYDGSWVCDNFECRGELDEENQPIKKGI